MAIIFRAEGERGVIRHARVRDFINTGPALQELLKALLRVENKRLQEEECIEMETDNHTIIFGDLNIHKDIKICEVSKFLKKKTKCKPNIIVYELQK